jgi:hypothetical protein
MRQAQYREFAEVGIEPYLTPFAKELRVTVRADIDNMKLLHNTCMKAQVFAKFIEGSGGTNTYRIEQPQYGENFGGLI